MGNIYKMTEERLKGDPYIRVCNQALHQALKQLSAST